MLEKYLILGLKEYLSDQLLIALTLLIRVCYLDSSACAAANLAIGTLKGEQET